MSRTTHPSGFHHLDGYCPARIGRYRFCNRTIVRDGMCQIHANAADRAKVRPPRPTYADLRAERDALAAKVDRVDALADLIDRHPEREGDAAQFRHADTGVWWDVSDSIRAALEGEDGAK